MKTLLIAVAAVFIVIALAIPTSYTDEKKQNKENFNNPVKVGTLPDGREVFRIEIYRSCCENHYFYYTDKSGTINYETGNKKNKKVSTIAVEIE